MGECVIDGWLPNILVNMEATIAKICFVNERSATLVTSFLSSHQMPGY